MKLSLSALTVKPLLYAVGVLVIVIGILLAVIAGKNKSLDVAAAQLEAAHTSRDAWKREAEALESVQAANRAGIDTIHGLLKEQQQTFASLFEQNQQAAIRAAHAADRADAAFRSFNQRFRAQSVTGACAQALKQMEAACPALSDY